MTFGGTTYLCGSELVTSLPSGLHSTRKGSLAGPRWESDTDAMPAWENAGFFLRRREESGGRGRTWKVTVPGKQGECKKIAARLSILKD